LKILNFRSLNLDYIYEVDYFVRPGETLSAASQTAKAGVPGVRYRRDPFWRGELHSKERRSERGLLLHQFFQSVPHIRKRALISLWPRRKPRPDSKKFAFFSFPIF